MVADLGVVEVGHLEVAEQELADVDLPQGLALKMLGILATEFLLEGAKQIHAVPSIGEVTEKC